LPAIIYLFIKHKATAGLNKKYASEYYSSHTKSGGAVQYR